MKRISKRDRCLCHCHLMIRSLHFLKKIFQRISYWEIYKVLWFQQKKMIQIKMYILSSQTLNRSLINLNRIKVGLLRDIVINKLRNITLLSNLILFIFRIGWSLLSKSLRRLSILLLTQILNRLGALNRSLLKSGWSFLRLIS